MPISIKSSCNGRFSSKDIYPECTRILIFEGYQKNHIKIFDDLTISDFGEVSDLLLQKYKQLKHQRLSFYLYIHESRIKNNGL